MKQQVLVFILGAFAAFGVAGLFRPEKPVAVLTPATFEAPQQAAAASIPVPVIDQTAVESAPVESSPVPQEPRFTRARSAPHASGIRRAAAPADSTPAAGESRPVETAQAGSVRAPESPRTDAEPVARPEPKLRQRETRPADQAPAVESPRDPSVSPTPAPVSAPDPVVRERSRKQSAVIVAGSAAAGALIGAAAGRGKGAAIGALTGAAGGYVYDRMTHRKVERPALSGTGARDTSGYRDTNPAATDDGAKIDTLKRVGVGAASGAVIGGLAGHGRGAAIGAVTGGAAGYIYDRVRRH